MLPIPLAVKLVQFTNKINNDAGSGAKKDLVTWKPDLGDGWYYAGPGATNTQSESAYGTVFKELERGTLADVDWQVVWTDAGSGKATDYSLWRAVALSPDFIAIGGYFIRSHEKPIDTDVKAIRKDLLVSAVPGVEVWNDAGSHAKADGAVWSISNAGNANALGTGAFVPVEGYGKPPAVVYALDYSKVVRTN